MGVSGAYILTEAGCLPADWKVKPLGDVLSKARLGGNYPNSEAESAYPLMKMGNLGRGRFDLAKVQFVASGSKPAQEHLLRSGDVLFNTRNTLDLVGKVALWRNELPVAYYNSNLLRLEFDPEQVGSNEYMNLYLNTKQSVAMLRALATGTTSVAAIYTRDLLGLPVAVPPAAEQRAIAEALSDVDALLSGLDRLIAKKRDLKQAAMQQLLTGKTRLPGFQGEWEVKRLCDLADFKAGSYLPSAQYSAGNVEVQGAGGAMGCCDAANYPIPITVLGRVGTVGKPRFLPKGCWVNNNAGAVVARPQCAEPEYVHRLLLTVDWSKVVSVTAQPFLVVGDLMSLAFRVPALREQAAIAAVLSDMDAELAALEARRDKTRALKQGMMQELLTGRTRLV